MSGFEMQAQFYPLVTDLERLKEEAAEEGLPSSRWRTVTIMPRVVVESGRNKVSVVPLIRPFS